MGVGAAAAMREATSHSGTTLTAAAARFLCDAPRLCGADGSAARSRAALVHRAACRATAESCFAPRRLLAPEPRPSLCCDVRDGFGWKHRGARRSARTRGRRHEVNKEVCSSQAAGRRVNRRRRRYGGGLGEGGLDEAGDVHRGGYACRWLSSLIVEQGVRVI